MEGISLTGTEIQTTCVALSLRTDWQVTYMQQLDPEKEMLRQWINVEHHRLHCVEEWPDSSYKEVVLLAIRSALQRLKAGSLAPIVQHRCIMCETRAESAVLKFPSRQPISPAISRLAA
jgi:hypothetical protein